MILSLKDVKGRSQYWLGEHSYACLTLEDIQQYVYKYIRGKIKIDDHSLDKLCKLIDLMLMYKKDINSQVRIVFGFDS